MMALRHFAGDARALTEQAVEIARELGSSNVEAEHLLLAASGSSGPAGEALRAAGLDFDGIASALVAEMERSLAAVGVSAEPLVFTPDVSRPRFATSAKVALERTLKTALVRGEKQISSGHVVLGVLGAERGTVPRALECAGVDRTALRAQVEAAL
jgi:ATP-dependent Clp protease ATP-binding subunit ClpA